MTGTLAGSLQKFVTRCCVSVDYKQDNNQEEARELTEA